MPFTPATTDKFTKVGTPGTATTLAAPGYVIGNASINVGSTTNWPTDTLVRFGIDVATIVNGLEVRTAGTYNEFSGIVTSATVISSLTREYGTAQNYNASSLTRIYIPVAATRENALIDGLGQDHNLKGNHKTLTDDNGNNWLERAQVASAVNNVKVTNAIAGTDPRIDASGADSNPNLKLFGKGTGKTYTDLFPPQQAAVERGLNHVASGGIWSGLGYGSTLTATMTALACYINGRRIVIATVATRTFTANKDTYIDVLDNADGTGTLVYTEVANNAASPALAANSIRIATVVTAANIAAATSIGQGGFANIVPVISSQILKGFDTLGNLIYPKGTDTPTLTQNPYKFNVYLAANQTGVVDATTTKVAWDTKKFDTGNNFDTTLRRFVAPVAGFYQINAYVCMLSPANNAFEGIVYLFKNGADIQHTDIYPTVAGTSIILNGTISTLVQLAAGDYLEIFAWMDVNTSTVTVVGGAVQSSFSGFLVSAS